MTPQKPSIPKGTRDFSPVEMVRRQFIFNAVRNVFQRYGYVPVETPALENLSTLTGKYGEEGDKLLFKILNSGNFIEGITGDEIQKSDPGLFASRICEKGLRYDLTVPFARYVVMHLNEIAFPFKRYQIQPVWRADKPQKGRYREFVQCDVDVIGSDSLLNEVELIQIIHDVFNELHIAVSVKLNNRKILAGIAEVIGAPDKFNDLTVAIDKLDKIGHDKVYEELAAKGFSEVTIGALKPILELAGTNDQKISRLGEILRNSTTGMSGLEDVRKIFDALDTIGLSSSCDLDLTLARGLNYYTGCIIEVKSTDVRIGSLCGGGRYDDLTGIFGLPGVSGVGISFGADRIYDVLDALNLFPAEDSFTTKVLFINFGPDEEKYCLPLADRIRRAGINCEIFPDPAKVKKQMRYADQKNIPWVVLIGENEMKGGLLTIKNMKSGEQREVSFEELINQIKPDHK
jgi:histidyl-tRNA synthetase